MTFDFHPEAREEFHEAAHWYEDRSIFAGDRFVKAVRTAVDAIIADPFFEGQRSPSLHAVGDEGHDFSSRSGVEGRSLFLAKAMPEAVLRYRSKASA